MSALYTPDDVGHSFVKQYYEALNSSPQDLHKYYDQVEASFSHGEEGSRQPPVTGQKEIHECIKTLNFQNCKANISQVDCQNLFDNNGVVVQVIGTITRADNAPRKFLQTFVLRCQALTEQTARFVLFNDIFRYVKEPVVAASAPVAEPEVVAAHADETSNGVATPETPAAETTPEVQAVAEPEHVAAPVAAAPVVPQPAVVSAPAATAHVTSAPATKLTYAQRAKDAAAKEAHSNQQSQSSVAAAPVVAAPVAVAPVAAAPVPAAATATASASTSDGNSAPANTSGNKRFHAGSSWTPAQAAKGHGEHANKPIQISLPHVQHAHAHAHAHVDHTPSPEKLFISGIPLTTTEADLVKLFNDQFGVQPKSVIIKKKTDAPNSAFAFVELDSVEAGKKALAAQPVAFQDAQLNIRQNEPNSNKKYDARRKLGTNPREGGPREKKTFSNDQ